MLAVQVGVGLREFVLQREPRELSAKIADYSASLLYDNRAVRCACCGSWLAVPVDFGN
jgi:hypothetical protein